MESQATRDSQRNERREAATISYNRAGTPPDLSDDSWRLNAAFAHVHPYQKGVGITDAACRHCAFCGQQFSLKEHLCPDCQSPTSHLLKANSRFSLTPKNVSAQSNRPVNLCWSVDEDPISGDIKRHKLEEISVPVVDVATQEYHLEIRCKVCGTGYTRVEGRGASESELADARAGKIAKPTKFLAGAGTNP